MAGKKKAVPAPEPTPEPTSEPKPLFPPKEPELVGIDARMAALLKDHQRMGARPT